MANDSLRNSIKGQAALCDRPDCSIRFPEKCATIFRTVDRLVIGNACDVSILVDAVRKRPAIWMIKRSILAVQRSDEAVYVAVWRLKMPSENVTVVNVHYPGLRTSRDLRHR